MIFYTALFTTLIAAVPAYLSWVAPSVAQLGLFAVLGAGANLLLYCLLKSFDLVDASALAPFRCPRHTRPQKLRNKIVQTSTLSPEFIQAEP